MLSAINFINLDQETLKEILFWRNSKEIRKWMFNQNEISLKEHLEFVESLQYRKDKVYYLVKKGDKKLGVFDLNKIKDNEAYLGIYLNPIFIGQGYGSEILSFMLDFSRENHAIKVMKLEVFTRNIPAINLYENLGFVILEESMKMITMCKQIY